MRVLFPLLLSLVLAACGGGPSAPQPAPQPPPGEIPAAPPDVPVSGASSEASPPAGSKPVQPPAAVIALGHGRTRIGGMSVEFVRFDSRRHRLVVIDQAGGPSSEFADSRAAGRSSGALAAINGGFFTPQGEPLGRVVTAGEARGGINRASSLGSGFFVEESGGKLALLRRSRFTGGREALQSGPFLVENGRRVGGLSADSPAARSWLATDGASGWLIARSSTATLAELAAALEGAEIGGIRVQTALNLDGGRSSELWVSAETPGGPAFTRPLWNKPVRNFLAIRRR